MSEIVIHGLSIFRKKSGLYKIRSTIRIGPVKPGQQLTFTDTDGRRHSLTVKECIDGPGHHTTIMVDGTEEDIKKFKGGYYLYSV